MASKDTNTLILDILALSHNLPTGPKINELKNLLLQLPGAAKADRDVAAQRLTNVAKQLTEAEDRIARLKNDVRRLEDDVSNRQKADGFLKMLEREGLGRADVRTTNGRRRESGHTQKRRNADSQSATGMPVKIESADRLETPSSAQDPPHDCTRRRSASVESITPGPVLPQLAAGADMYRPERSSKRQRTSVSPTRDRHRSRSQKRATPVCGRCYDHDRRGSCDGGVTCGRCRSRGDRSRCTYNKCLAGADCEDPGCDYLHPDQWDNARERGRRIVQEARWDQTLLQEGHR